MVLLESALVIPMLLLVAIAGLGVARVAIDELAVVAAARDGALSASRGADAEQVGSAVAQRLPTAAVALSGDHATVSVRVSMVSAPVPWFSLRIGHSARSVAARE